MSLIMKIVCLLTLSAGLFVITDGIEIDPFGYIMYCPCMGRFGNQAEQFLGALHFARHLNRTLILPPFIEYDKYGINLIPFESYIQVEPLRQYHRVILMDDFLQDLAPIIWKEADRSITCYSPRTFGNKDKDGQSKPETSSCNAFEGSPFKEFWHRHNITSFPAGSLYYQPLHTDYNFVDEWNQAYGGIRVLTFVGAPSSFPTTPKATPLQMYVHFSTNVADRAQAYRADREFDRRAYLSVHLRHGTDWSRACDLIKTNDDLHQLFSSGQCLGEEDSNYHLEYELCMPSPPRIIKEIRTVLNAYNQQHLDDPIKHLHIATDYNNETLWRQIYDAFDGRLSVIGPQSSIAALSGEVTFHSPAPLITDLYLMSYANVMIGNCISSFSAFATRYRLHHFHFHSTTHFFHRIGHHKQPTNVHEEL